MKNLNLILLAIILLAPSITHADQSRNKELFSTAAKRMFEKIVRQTKISSQEMGGMGSFIKFEVKEDNLDTLKNEVEEEADGEWGADGSPRNANAAIRLSKIVVASNDDYVCEKQTYYIGFEDPEISRNYYKFTDFYRCYKKTGKYLVFANQQISQANSLTNHNETKDLYEKSGHAKIPLYYYGKSSGELYGDYCHRYWKDGFNPLPKPPTLVRLISIDQKDLDNVICEKQTYAIVAAYEYLGWQPMLGEASTYRCYLKKD